LRRLREAAGLGVSELARLAGLSRRHLTEIEAGRANPSVTRLVDLTRALEVDPADLLTGDADRRGVARGGRIALVGLRGAGKSSVGSALALALEVPFVELDRRIEDLAGLALAAIFELHGSAGFRRLEAEALERVLAEGERFVLATGGSIVTSPATFARLRQACHTVWLRTGPEIHYERVLAQGDRRPMAGRPRALDELKQLLAEREPLYARCEHQLDTTDLDVEQTVERLVERYGDRRSNTVSDSLTRLGGQGV
jgi:XRE family transcriptional regulator, aerobic/anaerobic benzoate catabolism transcriptional regulator